MTVETVVPAGRTPVPAVTVTTSRMFIPVVSATVIVDGSVGVNVSVADPASTGLPDSVKVVALSTLTTVVGSLSSPGPVVTVTVAPTAIFEVSATVIWATPSTKVVVTPVTVS